MRSADADLSIMDIEEPTRKGIAFRWLPLSGHRTITVALDPYSTNVPKNEIYLCAMSCLAALERTRCFETELVVTLSTA